MHVSVLHQPCTRPKQSSTLLACMPPLFPAAVRSFVNAQIVHLGKDLGANAAHIRLPVGGLVLGRQMAVQIAGGKKTSPTLVTVVILLPRVTSQMDFEAPGPLKAHPALRTIVTRLLGWSSRSNVCVGDYSQRMSRRLAMVATV